MDLRAQLARAGRTAVDKGLVVGSGGNLSARAPGGQEFWMTRSGTWLDRLDESSFVAVPLDADERPVDADPSVEWRLHQLTYRARSDVNAVVHLHPQLLVLLDAAGVAVRQITTDHVYYLGRIGAVGYHRPGTIDLAAEAARVAEDHDVMVLARHGCSALGGDVDMALRRALNLGEAAMLTYRSLMMGCGPEIGFPDELRADLDNI